MGPIFRDPSDLASRRRMANAKEAELSGVPRAVCDGCGALASRTFSADVGTILSNGAAAAEIFFPSRLCIWFSYDLQRTSRAWFTVLMLDTLQVYAARPARPRGRTPHAHRIHSLLGCARAPVALRIGQPQTALVAALLTGWQLPARRKPRVARARAMSSGTDGLSPARVGPVSSSCPAPAGHPPVSVGRSVHGVNLVDGW